MNCSFPRLVKFPRKAYKYEGNIKYGAKLWANFLLRRKIYKCYEVAFHKLLL